MKVKNTNEDMVRYSLMSMEGITIGMKKIFKGFYKYWMKFVGLLDRINSVIILSLLFVSVFGIYSIVKKIFRYPFFKRKKISSQNSSFWVDKKYQPPTIENLKRQF